MIIITENLNPTIKKLVSTAVVTLALTISHQVLAQPCMEVPEEMKFCGKNIDLTRYDMHQRFDREQITFLYSHQRSIMMLKNANQIFPIVAPILKANDIPADMIYLMVIESNLNKLAVSPAKAAGLWQFLSRTAQTYGLEVNDEIDERYHIEKATVAACKYLKDAYAKFGDWATACASYNAGMNGISAKLEAQQADSSFDLYLIEETSRYVFRIMAAKHFFQHPADYGFHLSKKDFYHTIRTRDVVVNTAVADWAQWAKEQGINYAILRDFNPWIRSNRLTNKQGKIYTVKIPLVEDLKYSASKVKIYNHSWIE